MSKRLPQRTRAHELETLSHRHVESIFPAEWICRRVEDDYGLDLRVEIVTGEQVTGLEFSVQLKATGSLKTSGDNVVHRCKVSTAQYFLQRPEPVMYVVYDAQKKVAYWRWVQPYLEELDRAQPDWRQQKTIQIPIPCANRLTTLSVPLVAEQVREWWGRIVPQVGWERLPAAKVTSAGVKTIVPFPEAVARHRASLRDRLETDARARWGEMSVYIQEAGVALPVEASPYQMGQLGPRENLLCMLHAAERILVLGEPGSGKTVVLERLAWELCGESEPMVPVLIRLFHYGGAPLSEWVRALLQETGHLQLDNEHALTVFLKEGGSRCFFLFDGLNEVAPPHRDRLIDELVRWIAAYPRHPVILTSRLPDELWRQMRGEVRRTVMIQPITDEQAQMYLVTHLGETGKGLYGRLDNRLREMARTPLILWLIKEAGRAAESTPGSRGELYQCFVSQILRRDTYRGIDAEISERITRRALADLAYHLGKRHCLSCSRDAAVAVIARRLGEELAETVVRTCARHGLLAGEEMVWFAPHQTMQEYFAALALREVAEREWRTGRWGQFQRTVHRLVTRKNESLALLAADDWWMETFVQLAGLLDNADQLAREIARVNPWLAWWCVEEGRGVTEETQEAVEDRSVRLLESKKNKDRRRAVAALARMRSTRAAWPLLRVVLDHDAEVAGLAMEALATMGKALQPLIRKAVQGTDRRLRVAGLCYLVARPQDSSWAVQLLRRTAAEPGADVARLAAQILLGIGRVARAEALALAQQPEHPLHRVGLVYLEVLLGQPMVWIQSGPFLMGSSKSGDPQAYDDELPRHRLTLPGYWLGRCPVTVADFRIFVQETEYKGVDKRSLEGPPDHPVVFVTWHDALAYCRWLSDRTGIRMTLPSEAEWEKAARGIDGYIYPWGDLPPNEKRCNFDRTVGSTTPVGQYSSQGDSPYGCADMAGNVWEWTRSHYEGYPYRPKDDREDVKSGGVRVFRGGAFNCWAGHIRCAVRFKDNSGYRYGHLGFRVTAFPGRV